MASKRRLRVSVNGKPYIVEVGDLNTFPTTVNVNGKPCLVDIGAEELEVVPAGAGAAALNSVARPTSAPEKTPTPTGPAGPLVQAVKAPMPGNVIDIAVKAGDQVSFRQQLCALEAMKMKNAIRSPRDGVIASVKITEGQAVAHGDILFTFE
ncbi:MAG TPA: acetyl-CoA carboxylase biotin carboxyl carrier protein subunit [Chloroflexi bacterium]|nr:acetyl-CoA carboxylase biotin carboxyl carrier protein subunit [Chloroflexota bacterium]